MKTSKFTLLALFALCGWGLVFCTDRPSGKEAAQQPFQIKLEVRKPTTNSNIRGLFLVNDSIGWASGSRGTFLRMTDGENWISDTIAG